MAEYTKSLYYRKNSIDEEIKIYDTEGEVGTPNLKIYDGGATRYIKLTEGDGIGGSPSDLRIMHNNTVHTIQRFAGGNALSIRWYMTGLNNYPGSPHQIVLKRIKTDGSIETVGTASVELLYGVYPSIRVNLTVFPGDRFFIKWDSFNDILAQNYINTGEFEVWSDIDQSGDRKYAFIEDKLEDQFFTDPVPDGYYEFYYTGLELLLQNQTNPYRFQTVMRKVQFSIILENNVNSLIGINKIDSNGNVIELATYQFNNSDTADISVNADINTGDRLFLSDKTNNIGLGGAFAFTDIYFYISTSDLAEQQSFLMPVAAPTDLFYSTSDNNYYELLCNFDTYSITGSYETDPYRF